ncbi:MAG: acyltransferase family protein, partial [Terriglobales bacterium]
CNIELPTGHVPELDGVRGVAIGLVLVYHVYCFAPFSFFTSIGWSGVDLFFVLSGFLITGILLDSKHKPHYYKNFITRRALRIFPLYYFALAVFFSLNAKYNLLQPYFWTYTQNIFIAFHGWPPVGLDALNHFWSLAQEEQFYLFWPIAVLYLTEKSLIRASVLGIALSLVLRNINPTSPFTYVFFFCRFDSMLIGALTAILIRHRREILNRVAAPLCLVTVVMLGAAIAITRHKTLDSPFFMTIGYTICDLFYASIVLLALDRNKVFSVNFQRIFRSKWLTFLGKYSYGIYVYHGILFYTIYPLYFQHISVVKNETGDLFIAASLFTALVLVVSYLSYQLLEVRFLDLKKKLT